MLNPADSKLAESPAKTGDEIEATQPAVTAPAFEAGPGRDALIEPAAAWLGLIGDMLDGATRAIVLRPAAAPPGAPRTWQPTACWPAAEGDMSRLLAVADAAGEQERTVVRPHPTPDDAAEVHDIAHPIQVGNEVAAIVAVEVAHCPEQRLPIVVRQIQLATAYLANLLASGPAAETASASNALESALWLVATCLEHERFRGATTAVATDLAAQFSCERVAIGSTDGVQTKVEGLSHSADFGERMNLIRRIGAAMDEAIDQRATVVLPAPPDAPALGTSAHEELTKEDGSGAACTVLLNWNDDVIGAITLERSARRPFEPAEVETLEDTAALLGPILELKRRDDRWFFRKAWDTCRAHAANLVGASHIGMKAATIGVLALILVLSVWTRTFRIGAPAALEGEVVRAAVAPLDGYIIDAPVRAGDLVTAGEVLATLDDRVLLLERRNWQSQRDQTQSEYLEAMAEQERVRMNVLRAGIEQADAQIGLIDEQLARLRIVAPIDGLVVSGDLSQSIGAPVQQGDVLFEVAPLDAYRLMLEVDERDIAYVQTGQSGHVVLAALPETIHSFTVTKVTPVSDSEEGTNFFLVEARLDEAPELLRPGMEGVGKVDVDRRRVIWILTRPLTTWLRLFAWSWWGPTG